MIDSILQKITEFLGIGIDQAQQFMDQPVTDVIQQGSELLQNPTGEIIEHVIPEEFQDIAKAVTEGGEQ